VANNVNRDLVRNYFGASEQLVGIAYIEAEFTVELQGSGTAATAPAWGALLRAAGHANGLDIELTTIIGYDWMEPAALTIAEQLKRVDIRVTIRKLELGVWIRNFRAKEMGFTFNDWGTTPDPGLLYYRHFRAAPEGADFRNWNNARASALLDRGQETADPAQRRQSYAEFQKLLAEEVPTIMLFSADLLTANRSRLKNYVQHGTGWYFGLAKAWVEG
jgi:peptide/nickel transport system substrate-binding protein